MSDPIREIFLRKGETAITRADPKGRIIYCNRVFRELSGYTERELLGVQHSLVRHPDMPKWLYRIMWGALLKGHEFACLIKNRSRDGAYYWCRARISPSYDYSGQLQGYFATRMEPESGEVAAVTHLYEKLKELEGCVDDDALLVEIRNELLRTGRGITHFRHSVDSGRIVVPTMP